MQQESLAYFDSISRGMLATILALSDNEVHYLEEMQIGRILLEMRNMTLGARSNACFMHPHETGFYTTRNTEMAIKRHESIVLQMMHRGGDSDDVTVNYGLLYQFLIYGHYDCGNKLDELLAVALLIGNTKILESFQRAGCNLKEVHNSRGENLLLISLQVASTMPSTVYVELVAYLISNGVDPVEVTESTETSCGLFSHVFQCCGCHYFDFINGDCENKLARETKLELIKLYKNYIRGQWLRGQ